ncbi:MAG TPA: cytochrome b/b6 domain-containing protein [Steroidobacteraceae bacterium]
MHAIPHRYDRTSILLHWVTATLVVALWLIAHWIDDFPRGTPRITVRSIHILLGVILLTVVLARMIWRLKWGHRLPPASQGPAGYLAKTVHYALYALLLAVLFLGVANVWVRGDNFFGLFSVPKFSPDQELRHNVEDLHETVANLVLIVAGLHALAALAHHYFIRDGVLRRMLPQSRPKP